MDTSELKIESHFHHIEKTILSYIKDAEFSLLIASAYFTNQTLLSALIERVHNGLQVELLISEDNNATKPELYTLLNQFMNAGGIIRAVEVKSGNYSIMHHKFCVIDSKTTITGSYNWTNNANLSKENIVVIPSVVLSQTYIDTFYSLREVSSPPSYLDNSSSSADYTYFVSTTKYTAKNTPFSIYWDAPDADSVLLDDTPVATSGSQTESISTSAHFTLTALYEDREITKKVFIEVIERPIIQYRIEILSPWSEEPLQIETFQVRKDSFLAPIGSSIKLYWESEYADEIQLLPGNQQLSTKGEVTLTPERTTIYTIQASNRLFSSEQKLTLDVVQFPKINRLDLPFPEKILTEVKLNLPQQVIPPSFSLESYTSSLRLPYVTEIQHELQQFANLESTTRTLNFKESWQELNDLIDRDKPVL